MTSSSLRSRRPRTPCVGMCSTTYGDLICRGCRRFSHEIVDWNRYGDDEKRAVWARLDAFKEQVVLGRLEVVNAALLEEKLRRHRIPFTVDDGDGTRVYELLRRGARHMRRLQPYGLRAHPDFAEFDPLALRDLIDRDLLILSEAHYERYLVLDRRATGF